MWWNCIRCCATHSWCNSVDRSESYSIKRNLWTTRMLSRLIRLARITTDWMSLMVALKMREWKIRYGQKMQGWKIQEWVCRMESRTDIIHWESH